MEICWSNVYRKNTLSKYLWRTYFEKRFQVVFLLTAHYDANISTAYFRPKYLTKYAWRKYFEKYLEENMCQTYFGLKYYNQRYYDHIWQNISADFWDKIHEAAEVSVGIIAATWWIRELLCPAILTARFSFSSGNCTKSRRSRKNSWGVAQIVCLKHQHTLHYFEHFEHKLRHKRDQVNNLHFLCLLCLQHEPSQ